MIKIIKIPDMVAYYAMRYPKYIISKCQYVLLYYIKYNIIIFNTSM